MPIHDWSRVDAGLFHDFHQAWTIEICNVLNSGVVPTEFFSLIAEGAINRPIPDLITLQRRTTAIESGGTGGIAVADAPPRARFVALAEADMYAAKANRIVVRHHLGRVVAVIEIVSPGNKSSQHALRSFADKAGELLLQGINLLVVDLFPPSRRDPQGIHKAIWERICDESFELPADKPLTAAAYSAGSPKKAYVEPIAVGDLLPSLPIFLDEGTYVPAPLETTYNLTWSKCPQPVREVVEP